MFSRCACTAGSFLIGFVSPQSCCKTIAHVSTWHGKSGVDADNIVYMLAWRFMKVNSDVRMPAEMRENVAFGDLVEACCAISWLCKRFASGTSVRHGFCTSNKCSYALLCCLGRFRQSLLPVTAVSCDLQSVLRLQ